MSGYQTINDRVRIQDQRVSHHLVLSATANGRIINSGGGIHSNGGGGKGSHLA
jgi:hypothetical protein